MEYGVWSIIIFDSATVPPRFRIAAGGGCVDRVRDPPFRYSTAEKAASTHGASGGEWMPMGIFRVRDSQKPQTAGQNYIGLRD